MKGASGEGRGTSGAAPEDWRGCSRRDLADGFSLEIRLVEKWRAWRATIVFDDGSTFDLYGGDYDDLSAEATLFVSALIAHRREEAAAPLPRVAVLAPAFAAGDGA